MMKEWLKKSVLLGAALIICMFLGEVLIRVIVPQQLIFHDDLRIFCPDSLTSYHHQPNLDVPVNLGEGLVRYVTDKNGYRINPSTKQISPQLTQRNESEKNEYQVLALGDSFLEGLQVENEETIPQVLKKLLFDQWGVKVQVDNSGVGGWNPNHYYLETRRALSRKQYDLGIVFIYTANDFVNEIDTVMFIPDSLESSIHHLCFPEEISWQGIIQSLLYPINDWLERRSHLFIFVKTRSEFLLSKLGLTAIYFPDVFLTNQLESERWRITGTLFDLIKTEFTKHNLPVIFVLA